MRLTVLLVVAGVFAAAAAPAFAASQKDHDDCNADDVERNIAGCTRVLDDAGESDKVRSIAHVGRGLALHQKGEIDRAIADLTAAIGLDPQNSLAYNDRGLMWREKGDIARAIADFDAAIKIAPLPRSDLPGVPRVNIYANRGLAYEAKGDFDRALADFDRAVAQAPDDAQAYYQRAELQLERHAVDRALADLDTVLKLRPDAAQVYFLRGNLRYRQYMGESPWIRRGDLEGAIADFSQTIRHNGANARVYYARGIALNTLGDQERAIADLLQAAKLDPINPDVRTALKALKPDYQPPGGGLLKLLEGDNSEERK